MEIAKRSVIGASPLDSAYPPHEGVDVRTSQKGFQRVWQQVSEGSEKWSVKKGDTLVGIVAEQYKRWGVDVSDRVAYRQALDLAKANGIENPNLIYPGQDLNLGALKASAAPASALEVLRSRANQSGLTPPTTTAETTPPTDSSDLLEQTLVRAANKGFIHTQDVAQAKQKIMSMAHQFGFEPDHFAMLTLMESDGMNPKASNGQCHGIIQFCEGASKGAASVGMAGRAREILGMGLVQQLDLVERYFKDLGLTARNQKMGLDDLYLSVLTPAARAENRRDAPLPIAGQQAKGLYAEGGRSKSITRQSIVEGLTQMAQRAFPQWRSTRAEQLARIDQNLQP
jgi:hypothetical protein